MYFRHDYPLENKSTVEVRLTNQTILFSTGAKRITGDTIQW